MATPPSIGNVVDFDQMIRALVSTRVVMAHSRLGQRREQSILYCYVLSMCALDFWVTGLRLSCGELFECESSVWLTSPSASRLAPPRSDRTPGSKSCPGGASRRSRLLDDELHHFSTAEAAAAVEVQTSTHIDDLAKPRDCSLRPQYLP